MTAEFTLSQCVHMEGDHSGDSSVYTESVGTHYTGKETAPSQSVGTVAIAQFTLLKQ